MKLLSLQREVPKRAAAAVLVLVAVAGAVTGREKPTLEPSEAPALRVEATPVAQLDIDLDKLRRTEPAAVRSDPFAPRSFAPPPEAAPAPARAVRAAAPSAPPLPFRYVGKLIANGKTEVFVMRGEELLSIASGQNIDGQYRVDAITESSIRFTYLPLKTRQSIDLEEASG